MGCKYMLASTHSITKVNIWNYNHGQSVQLWVIHFPMTSHLHTEFNMTGACGNGEYHVLSFNVG